MSHTILSMPRSPNMNAHAEGFTRTRQEQVVEDDEDLRFDDVVDFNRRVADWFLFYHTERPHPSLRWHSPVQCLLHQQPECQRWWTETNNRRLLGLGV